MYFYSLHFKYKNKNVVGALTSTFIKVVQKKSPILCFLSVVFHNILPYFSGGVQALLS